MNALLDFMWYLDRRDSLGLGNAPKKVQKWLEDTKIPPALRKVLQFNWPKDDSQIGHITIFSAQSMHDCDLTGPLLKQSFLLLGLAPNGDFFVIDLKTPFCVPGFISHDECYPPRDDARAAFAPLARSLESLVYRIVEKKYVPTDHCAARFFNKFIEEEERTPNNASEVTPRKLGEPQG